MVNDRRPMLIAVASDAVELSQNDKPRLEMIVVSMGAAARWT